MILCDDAYSFCIFFFINAGKNSSVDHLSCLFMMSLICILQVEIKRTIPKGAAPLKDFKTRKIFVGGIPTSLTEGTLCLPLWIAIWHSCEQQLS